MASNDKIQRTLTTALFVYFSAASVVNPLMSVYLSGMLNPVEVGIVMAILPLSMILIQPFWGIAADLYGVQRVLPLTLILAAAASVGFIFVRSFWGVLLVYAVYAIFIVSTASLLDVLILSFCRERYGRIKLWGTIGYGIGVFVCGVYKSQLLGFWNFLIHIPLLLITAFIVRRLPIKGGEGSSQANLSTGKVGGYAFLKNKKLIVLFFCLFLVGVICKGYDNFFPVGINNMGASDLLFGTTWVIGIIPEITLFYFMDIISRRFSSWHILIAGTVFFALRTAIIGFFPILWVWIAAQILNSMAFTCWYFGAISLIRDLTEEHQQASAQAAFWSISYGGGGIVGSFLSGYLVDVYGIPLLFQITSSLCILSVVILFILYKYGKRAKHPAQSLKESPML